MKNVKIYKRTLSFNMTLSAALKNFKSLKAQIIALYFITKDKRVTALPRLIAIITLAYAMSPIDFIPDFIPVLGYLDDLLIIPLGIWLVVKLTPDSIWKECIKKGAMAPIKIPKNYLFAGIIIAL